MRSTVHTRTETHTQLTRIRNVHTLIRSVHVCINGGNLKRVSYRGCVAVQQRSKNTHKKLNCEFSIVLLGSNSVATPRSLARFREFERPEHAPWSPAGTRTCAVVYTRVKTGWCLIAGDPELNPQLTLRRRLLLCLFHEKEICLFS